MTSFSCGVCSATFSFLAQAVDHVISHRILQKSCVVPGCHRTTTHLTRHLKRGHRQLCEHPCSLCKRAFVRAYDLRQHSDALHGGRTTYQTNVHRTEASTSYPYGATGFTGSSSYPYWLQGGIGCLSASLQNITVGSSASQNTNTREFSFNEETTVSDLNAFIADHLQPTMEFNTEMNRTVDKICSFLRENLSPNQIVKGGSMGKGTAVKGRADIDLVLVLNDVRDARDLEEKLPGIKRNIMRLLRDNAVFVATVISDTQFAVKFTVGDIDVDLLPTFSFTDLRRLYLKMRDDKAHSQYYSASLVEEQVNFVKEHPANLKSLIRLVKYWKKEKVQANGNVRIPTSYVMELITIHLWQKNAGGNGNFNTLKAFHGVMKALTNYRALNVVWNDNYDLNMIPRETQAERPLVMDPANPMNNVCERFSWDEIASAARRQLSSPMFRGINSDSWQ